MPNIGPGVREIRIHIAVEYRVCYVAKFAEAIYVLHAFEKRTRKTSRHDVKLARQRYQALVAHRSGEWTRVEIPMNVKITPSTGNVFRRPRIPPRRG